MPKMNISKSIFIDSKPEEIYKKLNDFHHWSAWSPWLIMEDGVKVDVEPDGKYYEWEGKRVGSGNMKVLDATENKEINYDLNFLKPWKSHANVGFHIEPKDNGANVTWTMDSSLPFFMFWMKKMMTAYVGMDYERGLRMLKDYLEEGKVNSQIEPKGVSTFEGGTYIGIKSETTIDNMGKDMESKMGKLMTFVQKNNVAVKPEALSIYHKWDMVNRKAIYTAGVMVENAPSELSDGIIAGNIPKAEVHTVSHKGSYEHLGNAWGLQYMMQRGKEFKGNKKIDPFEVYKNSPENTPKEELLTEVHFAVK